MNRFSKSFLKSIIWHNVMIIYLPFQAIWNIKLTRPAWKVLKYYGKRNCRWSKWNIELYTFLHLDCLINLEFKKIKTKFYIAFSVSSRAQLKHSGRRFWIELDKTSLKKNAICIKHIPSLIQNKFWRFKCYFLIEFC